jgi:hypothetical protein
MLDAAVLDFNMTECAGTYTTNNLMHVRAWSLAGLNEAVWISFSSPIQEGRWAYGRLRTGRVSP